MKYFLAAILVFVGISASEASEKVCIPFVQSNSTMMDADFYNICFQSDHVVRIKTIYSGKSGNMVEVTLRDGTWFYKSGLSAKAMKACTIGQGKCDKYQNVELRDLSRSYTKPKSIHRSKRDRALNKCAVSQWIEC